MPSRDPVQRNKVVLPEFKRDSGRPFFLFAGPCVIESEDMALRTAERLLGITSHLGMQFVYKSSFDKANRTASDSRAGPGREAGLKILDRVRQQLGVPVITDVHSVEDVRLAGEVVDVLQVPAFLCRQTDLVEAAAVSSRPVNIKKGQFLSHQEMRHVVEKARQANPGSQVMVCERGNCFGYNNLVVDMRGLEILKSLDVPVVFDATHSVQLPGAGAGRSGGQREFVPVLSRAAVAVGIDGLFMETHPDPDRALSDGPNSWPLDQVEGLLAELAGIDRLVKGL